MKQLLLSFMLVFFSQSALADVVRVAGTGIKFKAPNEFSQIPVDRLHYNWNSNIEPDYVVGNKRRSTFITYDVRSINISQNSLLELKAKLEATYNQSIPGITWQQSKIIEKAGQQWLQMEFTSNTQRTTFNNIVLVTSYKDKTVFLNFNSSKLDFPRYEKKLRRSIDSITILSKS